MTGKLRAFNSEYARYRQYMTERGEPAAGYRSMLLRLKRILIPQLAQGKTASELRVDFGEIFNPTKPQKQAKRKILDDFY
jgi:hypothetical protein